MACSSRSPVRMRAAVSIEKTKIFPSPILSVRPFRRPNPLASETVIPAAPSSDSASRTSSRREGSMTATMRFMRGGGLAAGGGGRPGIAARPKTRA